MDYQEMEQAVSDLQDSVSNINDQLDTLNNTDLSRVGQLDFPIDPQTAQEIDQEVLDYSTNNPLTVLMVIRPVYSGTFASGSTTYTQTDSTVTASSIIDVYAQATPVGTWSVSSSAGSFTITSSATETSNVAFKYFINNF